MGDQKKGGGITWTDATWNPVVGCSVLSPGCKHCYAMKMAARLEAMGVPIYQGLTVKSKEGAVWNGTVRLNPSTLDQPLRWHKPRVIFANSMSDLFHEGFAKETIATVFAVAIASVHLRGHTIQILTKRTQRMFEVLREGAFWDQVNSEAGMHVMANTDPLNRRKGDARATLQEYGPDDVPPGIWLGTSVENQAAAEERLMWLLGLHRDWPTFISAEPLLGCLNLESIKLPGIPLSLNALTGYYTMTENTGMTSFAKALAMLPGGRGPDRQRTDALIVGGESGAGAREYQPGWVRWLKLQCYRSGTKFFHKQVGSNHTGWDGITGKGADPAEWPADLRLQEMPA